MKRIGLVTIGQSPRDDIVPDMAAILGPDVQIPSTGGWQEWRPVTVEGLSLPAGRHALKVEAVKGGFNLNRLEFRKTG